MKPITHVSPYSIYQGLLALYNNIRLVSCIEPLIQVCGGTITTSCSSAIIGEWRSYIAVSHLKLLNVPLPNLCSVFKVLVVACPARYVRDDVGQPSQMQLIRVVDEF